MNSTIENSPCPCKSGKSYKECCLPYHQGKNPNSAVLLMRSRYSAYALGLIDYIRKTSHPDNQSSQKKILTEIKELQKFCKNTQFIDLKILSDHELDLEAFVTFHATLFQGKKDVSFTEKSRFLKKNGVWLYVDGLFLNHSI